MEFSVLGPLVLREDGEDLELPGARRRAVLLRLLIDAGRVIPASRLADDVWDGAPPPGAAATLQSHISYLRRIVGRNRLLTRSAGYVLTIGDGDEIDRDLAEDDVASGRVSLERGDADTAAQQLRRALGRFRGPALADVAETSWGHGAATQLEELRVLAVETLLEVELVRGRHRDVIARAELALTEHPLREHLWVLLITALYRDGRQADALRAYQRVRSTLAEELGIEPGQELRNVETAVLLQDDRLEPATTPSSASTLATLPTGVVTFLLTDVAGSTRLWEEEGARMADALAHHDEIIAVAVSAHGGVLLKARGEGDSTFSVFRRASDAASAAVELQARLQTASWPTASPVEVRVALHTGEAQERDGDYFGRAVNRAARLRSVAQASQVLVSQSTSVLLIDEPPSGYRIVDAGVVALQDLERPEPVYVLVTEGGVDAVPTLDRTHGNLPALLSDLIGRQQEVEELAGPLSARGLVTLVGPGGVGKTHLAIEAASRAAPGCPGGAWIVDLSGVVDAAQVTGVVAAALGVVPQPGRPVGHGLVERLRARRAILVLDNCEHLLDEVAALVATILGPETSCTLLATSRQPLGVPGEHIMTVAPLEVPSAADDASQHGCAAMQLFTERARAARPDFALTTDNAAIVARLCRRLDGLPLAIELAAARVRSFTPAEIESHLEQRFNLLRAGRSVPHRHQRLVDAIDWSYGLLDDDERRLLRGLSAFTGGCDVDAVISVFGDGAEGAPVTEVLDRLVEKSLVVAVPHGNRTRYRMLETIRDFARSRLEEVGDAEQVRRRCAEFVAELVAECSERLLSPNEADGIDTLARELDNVRAAQAWAIRAGDVDLALSMIVPLFWSGGHDVTHAAMAAALPALGMPGARTHVEYPLLLACAAWLCTIFGLDAAPEDLLTEADAASLDSPASVRCLVLNGIVARLLYTGQLDEAERQCARLIEVAASTSDPLVTFYASSHRASIGFIRRTDITAAAAQELAAAATLGRPSLLGIAHFHLGWAQTDLAAAVRHLERGLVLVGSVRNEFLRSVGLNMQAIVHAKNQDHGTALRVLLGGARTAWAAGDNMNLQLNLNYIASILAAHGHDEAAYLLREAAPSRVGAPLMEDSLTTALIDLPARLDTDLRADLKGRAASMTTTDLVDLASLEVEALLEVLRPSG